MTAEDGPLPTLAEKQPIRLTWNLAHVSRDQSDNLLCLIDDIQEHLATRRKARRSVPGFGAKWRGWDRSRGDRGRPARSPPCRTEVPDGNQTAALPARGGGGLRAQDVQATSCPSAGDS
jgi:hypothetical protein